MTSCYIVPTQVQMDRADNRMVQLKDLLHNAGLQPMTQRENTEDGEGVLRMRTLPHEPTLVGTTQQFDPMGHCGQLPDWLSAVENGRGRSPITTFMLKIRNTHRAWGGSIWKTPLTYAQQLTCTLVNRSAASDDKRRLVKVTLRAVPIKYGKRRFDNIKMAVKNDADQTRMYFGRYALICLHFLKSDFSF